MKRKPNQYEYDLLYSATKEIIPPNCDDPYNTALKYLVKIDWLNNSSAKKIALHASKRFQYLKKQGTGSSVLDEAMKIAIQDRK